MEETWSSLGTNTAETCPTTNLIEEKVEGLPISRNIQQMCEQQDLEDQLAEFDSDTEEEEEE